MVCFSLTITLLCIVIPSITCLPDNQAQACAVAKQQWESAFQGRCGRYNFMKGIVRLMMTLDSGYSEYMIENYHAQTDSFEFEEFLRKVASRWRKFLQMIRDNSYVRFVYKVYFKIVVFSYDIYSCAYK